MNELRQNVAYAVLLLILLTLLLPYLSGMERSEKQAILLIQVLGVIVSYLFRKQR